MLQKRFFSNTRFTVFYCCHTLGVRHVFGARKYRRIDVSFRGHPKGWWTYSGRTRARISWTGVVVFREVWCRPQGMNARVQWDARIIIILYLCVIFSGAIVRLSGRRLAGRSMSRKITGSTAKVSTGRKRGGNNDRAVQYATKVYTGYQRPTAFIAFRGRGK